MSGSVQAQPTVRNSRSPLRVGGFSAALILVAGVLIIPTTLVMAAASHTAPDTSDYIRMAFAQVAGATGAIVTSVALIIDRFARRAPRSTIAFLILIAAIVTIWEIQAINTSADFLLSGIID